MVHFSRWQLLFVVAVLLLGIVFALPNVLSRQMLDSLPDWVPNEQINLGLDLQGGSHLLLEVDVDSVFEEQLEGLLDTVRSELRSERIGYTDLAVRGDEVTFNLRDPSQADAAREALSNFLGNAEFDINEEGEASIGLTDQAKAERSSNVVQQSIEIVRRRIDETGTREPAIQQQGEERIQVQLPGVDNPERIKDLLGRTAKLTFHLVDTDASPNSDSIPAGSEALPSQEAGPDGEPVEYVVRRRVMVSGDNLTDAQATFQEGQPVVSFSFDSVGAQRFADVTSENVGQPFAIVLDGKVISAPVIREPITGGRGVISGDFTTQEVQDLALLLRAGALPAELTVIEERSIGPGLGADSVRAGEIASILGLVGVVIFIMLAYGLFGTMASLALASNIILIIAVLSGLQATLTLPGIAGIVLTIGMAVDANVLIFERIREEVRNGRGPVSAIDTGYRQALSAIIDGNVTTLIAAVLLFVFGTGPIKGFAITLAIGLVTSMFTAIMVTRAMIIGWLRHRRPNQLPI
ncbi:protein translocase subunit SecD [Fodinicurvata halophila]|uniref:Protein translocase subunit SecD n=1 Tax=Fodinicurvata halophila TaxID=1419723 RepID=A0ABV8UK07_9PROT